LPFFPPVARDYNYEFSINDNKREFKGKIPKKAEFL